MDHDDRLFRMSLVYFVPHLGSWDPKRVFEISEQLLKLALLKFTKEFLMEEVLTGGGTSRCRQTGARGDGTVISAFNSAFLRSCVSG